jgi:hypothetical protein
MLLIGDWIESNQVSRNTRWLFHCPVAKGCAAGFFNRELTISRNHFLMILNGTN